MAEKSVVKLCVATSLQLSCNLPVDGKGSVTARLGSWDPATLCERASVDALPLGVLPRV